MQGEWFVQSAEAAFIAELTDRDMNRVFDEHLVPAELLSYNGGRRFARLTSAFANFYFSTDSIFTAALRRVVVAQLAERVLGIANCDRVLGLRVGLAKSTWTVQLQHGQLVDVSSFVDQALLRARMVDEADRFVEASDDVMGGLPVFKGTRVPVDMVTASLERGITFERVLASYPFLTSGLVEAARVYQLVHPRRGRRRNIAEVQPACRDHTRRVVRAAAG